MPIEPASPWIDSQLHEPVELLAPGGNKLLVGIAVLSRGGFGHGRANCVKCKSRNILVKAAGGSMSAYRGPKPPKSPDRNVGKNLRFVITSSGLRAACGSGKLGE